MRLANHKIGSLVSRQNRKQNPSMRQTFVDLGFGVVSSTSMAHKRPDSSDGFKRERAFNGFVHSVREEGPNDPKLSDRRSGRGTCRWVERRWWSAAGAVTAEPVRCSAWLGVAVEFTGGSLTLVDVTDADGENDDIRKPCDPAPRGRKKEKDSEEKSDPKPSPDRSTNHKAPLSRCPCVVDAEVCADNASENADSAADNSGCN